MKGSTFIYLLNTESVKPQWSHSQDVELLDDHIYCLLPSIGTEDGFARLYPEMPTFVHDLSSYMLLDKVN